MLVVWSFVNKKKKKEIDSDLALLEEASVSLSIFRIIALITPTPDVNQLVCSKPKKFETLAGPSKMDFFLRCVGTKKKRKKETDPCENLAGGEHRITDDGFRP